MAERSSPALEIKDLNVYYGQSHALQGVNLRIAKGERVGLARPLLPVAANRDVGFDR